MAAEASFLESAARVLAGSDRASALRTIAQRLGAELPLVRFGVAVAQPGEGWFRAFEAHGEPGGPASMTGARLAASGTANGTVARTKEPHVNLEISDRAEFPEERAVRAAGAACYFCLPARVGDRVLGTVNVAFGVVPDDVDGWVRRLSELADLVGASLERSRLEEEVVRLSAALRARHEALDAELDRVAATQPVAIGPAFRRVLNQVEKVAPTDATVLLTGETGTGKEVLARHLHRSSPRAAEPFVAVNCAALPEGLAESELFGVVRGAFTGADRDRGGYFDEADGGTLFLDEIGDLAPAVQGKLLRVVQDGEVTPVGATVPHRVNVRLLAATHRDLAASVKEGRFREDLYHRMAAFPLHVPPLRERREDVPELVRQFVRSSCARSGKPAPAISDSLLRALSERDYPGNVRELRNLVERALVFSGDVFVLPEEDLPRVDGEAAAGDEAEWPTLDDVQASHIRATLARTKGRVYGPDGAAALLGLPPSTLKSRMIKLGLA